MQTCGASTICISLSWLSFYFLVWIIVHYLAICIWFSNFGQAQGVRKLVVSDGLFFYSSNQYLCGDLYLLISLFLLVCACWSSLALIIVLCLFFDLHGFVDYIPTFFSCSFVFQLKIENRVHLFFLITKIRYTWMFLCDRSFNDPKKFFILQRFSNCKVHLWKGKSPCALFWCICFMHFKWILFPRSCFDMS